MDRRKFLTRLGVGLVGVAVTAKVSWALPAKTKTWAALEYMRGHFNRIAKEHRQPPTVIYAAPALYAAMEGELRQVTRAIWGGIYIQRDEPAKPFFFFKCARVYEWPSAKDWDFAMAFDSSSKVVMTTEETRCS